jgi:5-(carboxyamino)imidazole ribonucleotide synthase
MSIQAAQRMGLRCLSLDSSSDTPASQIAASITGGLNDPDKIAEILRRCDRVTLENEFILADHIEEACEIAKTPESAIIPSISSLDTIQDKLRQRKALLKAGVPSPVAVPLEDDPSSAIEAIGFPMMIKTRFGGYDGKGAVRAETYEELERTRDRWEGGGWLAEQFVAFRREVAVMVYSSPFGSGCFPTMETVQVNHVCDLVFPAHSDASGVALAAVEAVGGVGLYGVELFELQDGSFQVNEIAPRPHNTGHYTLDWGGVSQFEQHVRLAMGWPLVEPRGGETCMANLLGLASCGNHVPAIQQALEIPGVFFHWYGKAESRLGRKMGHLNAVGPGSLSRAVAARDQFYRAWATTA